MGFAASDVKVAPSATLRLDIARPIEELRRGASRHVRDQIRRWDRIGVEIRDGAREDLPLLADLHARTAARGGFQPVSLDYLEHLWDALEPEGNVWMLIGSVGGDPVAADLLSRFAGVVSGRIHGFDHGTEHARARVPAALVWAGDRAWARAG